MAIRNSRRPIAVWRCSITLIEILDDPAAEEKFKQAKRGLSGSLDPKTPGGVHGPLRARRRLPETVPASKAFAGTDIKVICLATFSARCSTSGEDHAVALRRSAAAMFNRSSICRLKRRWFLGSRPRSRSAAPKSAWTCRGTGSAAGRGPSTCPQCAGAGTGAVSAELLLDCPSLHPWAAMAPVRSSPILAPRARADGRVERRHSLTVNVLRRC